jgi:hypothetical protein
MAAALPGGAAKYLSEYIDPADAFIAWHDGLTVKQAHSKVRNAARSFGASWPDRLPMRADCPDLQAQWAADPLDVLCAIQAAEDALGADGAGDALHAASIAEADTRHMADMFGLTQRRAQQIKKQQIEIARRQRDLFSDDDQGGAK